MKKLTITECKQLAYQYKHNKYVKLKFYRVRLSNPLFHCPMKVFLTEV